MRIGWILGVVAGCLALQSATAVAQTRRDTPDYWKCSRRVSGSWSFGQAPSACDAASFGDDRIVWGKYAALVFRENEPVDQETSRYLQEMHAILRDASAIYLRRRKPRVSPIEVVVFRRAILALAHQESYWTHFRVSTDSRLKMMRGDLGHGHGMMQIDDRFHFAHIKSGGAWDLIGNLVYALDLYYAEWEQAATAPCVSRAEDYEARARAAYSAYNGGSAQICRWTNSAHRWARNDQGFYQKFLAQIWSSRIPDPAKAASLNVACELLGGADCSVKPMAGSFAVSSFSQSPYSVGRWIRARVDLPWRSAPGIGATSVLRTGERAQIIDIIRAASAGGAVYFHIVNEAGASGWISAGTERADSASGQERFESVEPGRGGLIPMSWARIRAPKGIIIRRRPGGEQVGFAPHASRLRVNDVVVTESKEIHLDIVSSEGEAGFIYGGRVGTDLTTVPLWVGVEDSL